MQQVAETRTVVTGGWVCRRARRIEGRRGIARAWWSKGCTARRASAMRSQPAMKSSRAGNQRYRSPVRFASVSISSRCRLASVFWSAVFPLAGFAVRFLVFLNTVPPAIPRPSVIPCTPTGSSPRTTPSNGGPASLCSSTLLSATWQTRSTVLAARASSLAPSSRCLLRALSLSRRALSLPVSASPLFPRALQRTRATSSTALIARSRLMQGG